MKIPLFNQGDFDKKPRKPKATDKKPDIAYKRPIMVFCDTLKVMVNGADAKKLGLKSGDDISPETLDILLK